MSGTSLDGLDIAFCEFVEEVGTWTYKIQCAETIPYTTEWKTALSVIGSGSAADFVTTDVEYGHLTGRLTRDFIERNNIRADFIASHGHTVFHQPERKITSQVGRGSAIAAETGLPVVCDFRSKDVALGGQGAPLVPIGDDLLFHEFDFCLNIGGFANISFQSGGKRIAYDVCPANILLNQLALQEGFDYDPEGRMAAGGIVDKILLDTLNLLPYYMQPFPKSLGREWVVQHILPLLNSSGLPVRDLLATICEHIAIQVAASAGQKNGNRLLITGGGAFNAFLVSRIRHHATPEIIIPDAPTINFKEALIFAFLGVLRWRNEPNCLRSVTGALADSSGGAIY